MTTKRIKVMVPVIKTREELERITGQITALKTFEAQTKASMDQRITEIRSEYETQLGEAAEEMETLVQSVRQWAEANQSEFAGKKSLDLVHGVIGFRTGTPKLKTRKGWTWDKVLENLIALGRPVADFIRTKKEVDKEAILAARDNMTPADLRNLGVDIVQDESFYVEPKLTEVETRETAKAA